MTKKHAGSLAALTADAQGGVAAHLSSSLHLLLALLSFLFPFLRHPESHQDIKVSPDMFSHPKFLQNHMKFYQGQTFNAVAHHFWGTGVFIFFNFF